MQGSRLVVLGLLMALSRTSWASDGQPTRCIVHLDTPPPTLTRLLIVHKTSGTTQEVLWDPSTRVQLVQHVYLEDLERYHFAVQAESNFTPGSDHVQRHERAWVVLGGPLAPRASERRLTLRAPTTAPSNGSGEKGAATPSTFVVSGEVTISCDPPTTDATTPAANGRLSTPLDVGALREMSSVANSGGRGFLDQTPSQPIHELFSLVADVVVERVENQAFSRLKAAVLSWLCNGEASGTKALTVPLPGLEQTPLLPATCEQLRRISFRDLASAGGGLLRALLADAARAAVGLAAIVASPEKTSVEPGLALLLQPVTDALTSAASGQPLDSASLAQSLLLGVVYSRWGQAPCTSDTPALCVARVLLLSAQDCMQSGACTPQTVAASLGSLLAGTALDSAFKEALRHKLPAAIVLATRFADLLSGKASPNRRVVREAVDWLFDFHEFVTAFDVEMGAPELAVWKQRLRSVSELLDAAIAGEPQRLMVALGVAVAYGLDIAGQQDKTVTKTLSKVVSFLTTAASFLTQPEGTSTAEERAALRESRKKAIHNLIDELTARRPGQWVVGLGAGLGVSLTRSYAMPDDDQGNESEPTSARSRLGFFDTPLSLPLGFVAQYTPGGEPCPVGLHFGFDVFDLGAYLQLSDGGELSDGVTFGTVLAPGAQVGVLLGNPEMPLVISASGRFRPHFPDETYSAWQFGFFVGWHVPLFDFWTSSLE